MLNYSRLPTRYERIMNWKSDEDSQTDSESMSELPGFVLVWENNLQHLHWTERMVFLGLFSIVTLFALIGNILTLYAVFARQVNLL